MALTSKQRLALAICDFLNTSTTDGTLAADDKDSIDVAVNCIAESFKVDPADKAALTEAVGTQNLSQIYGVYEKLKGTSKPSASSSASASASAAAPSAEDIAKADALKGDGNRAMAAKDYPQAIASYTEALALNPRNAVYLSNRAAAHSAAKDHASAAADARECTTIDPSYTKGWSRLGLALYALGDPKGSVEAYSKGIAAEGNGGSDAMKKGLETAQRRVEELEAVGESADSARSASPPSGGAGGGMPDLSSLASMLGGGGGGGGGGGMPDFSQIMNNPMFASMAQNLMSNPEMMSNLMNNPRLRDMANQFGGGGGGGGGGGMPDMASLMNDPSIAEMARNMMGGGGGAPGAGRGAGGQ